MEILALKIITEIKVLLMDSRADWKWQIKE